MIKDQRGISLVELLGALGILSLIIILIGTAHLFGQKQFVLQTDEIDKQGEVRQVISQLTTDLRAVRAEEVLFEDNQLLIGLNRYNYEGTTLMRNDAIVSDEIEHLSFQLTKEGVEIEIASTENKSGKQSILETAIYFRK